MVDAVLDLLADGFHPTIRAVNLQRMTRAQEVTARGGQEITAGEQPRTDMLSGIEGPFPCDVHKVMRAGAAQSDNAGFGKRGREPVAEQGDLIGKRASRRATGNRDGCARPRGQALGTRL
jgi:hypothetical protein